MFIQSPSRFLNELKTLILKRLKGYSEHDVVKEGTVGCRQTVSDHFRLFHSNSNTILYSGHMWLAYVYNKSSAMHQTEAELFQSLKYTLSRHTPAGQIHESERLR